MIRTLVADDQPLVRAGFHTILGFRADIEIVGEAVDGRDAVTQTLRLRPDVVLMDIRMPRLDGIQATAELVRSGSRARMLILTTFDLDEYVYSAMKAGASGFLLKDVDPPDLVGAVRGVARGDALLAPVLTRRLIERFVSQPLPGASSPVLDRLSDRELQVLGLIARGKSNAEIGQALFVAEPTVKTHVSRVLSKLGLRDRVQAVVLAYEAGLVRPGTP